MAYVLAPTMSNALIRLPVDYFAVVGAAATPLGGVMSKLDDAFGCVTLNNLNVHGRALNLTSNGFISRRRRIVPPACLNGSDGGPDVHPVSTFR